MESWHQSPTWQLSAVLLKPCAMHSTQPWATWASGNLSSAPRGGRTWGSGLEGVGRAHPWRAPVTPALLPVGERREQLRASCGRGAGRWGQVGGVGAQGVSALRMRPGLGRQGSLGRVAALSFLLGEDDRATCSPAGGGVGAIEPPRGGGGGLKRSSRLHLATLEPSPRLQQALCLTFFTHFSKVRFRGGLRPILASLLCDFGQVA